MARPDSSQGWSLSATVPDSLRFEVSVPARARSGARVPVTLRVTNAGDQPAELYLRGRTIAFDIVVAGADGAVVWRRLAGHTIEAILQVRVLAPGEVLELRDAWRAGPPGRYTVRGELLTDRREPMRTAIVPLEVLPTR